MRSIAASFDDLFQGIDVIPIEFINESQSWQGSTLTFSLAATMGLRAHHQGHRSDRRKRVKRLALGYTDS
jgi:hypothetical protein